MIDGNTPIWQLTENELEEIIKKAVRSILLDFEAKRQPSKKYVYGIAGIAELFGCSKTTANAIKQSGKIDKAITQIGRQIVVDSELALSLAAKKK